jgi:DNA-binding NarL/FixJ family response regulator
MYDTWHTLKGHSGISRLLSDLGRVPVIPEHEIDFYMKTTQVRLAESDRELPDPLPIEDRLTYLELSLLKLSANGVRKTHLPSVTGRNKYTLDTHMVRARNKLRAHTITQAVAKAMKYGLIRQEDIHA